MAVNFGRKPAMRNDAGLGTLLQNAQRGSIYGSTPYHAWVVGFGVRCGKPSSGAANAWVQQALYQATTVLTTLVGATNGTVQVAAVMADRTGGADYRNLPTTPLQWRANQRYGIAARSDANTITFGQDNSGWVMHKRTGAAWPSPFSAASNDPEGKMSQWVELVPNTAPKLPSNVFPTDNGYVTTGNPTIAADFRDDEETLPGFALGAGDYVAKQHVRILNTAKTTVLKDSGVIGTNGTMQTNRRTTWAVPSTALAAGTYVAQVTHYDRFDAPSPVREWTFTVNAGGSLNVDIAAANIDSANPLVTGWVTPNLTATWEHDTAVAMAAWDIRIRQQDTDAIVRGPYGLTQALADGATATTVNLFAATGWASLPRGKTYRFEVSGITSGPVTFTPYTPSRWFRVDAYPNVGDTLLPAAGIAVVGIPVLSGRFTDPDDDSSTLSLYFYVRPSGNTGFGTLVANPSYQGNGRWGAQPTSAVVTGNGTWEWRAQAFDPVGGGSTTAWQSFVKVNAPVVAITAPASGATITIATPTVTWTVDRTQSTSRLRLYPISAAAWLARILAGVLGGSSAPVTLAYDSGTVSGSATSRAIPAATLRNATEYTAVLDVTTSDGLTTSIYSGFAVQYDALDAVANMTAVMSAGDYEPVGQESEVTTSWTAITSEVSDANWGGYIVRRTDLSTGEVDREWRLLTKLETTLTDRTPRSGVAYDYTVTFLYRYNEVEWIESDPATDQVQVVLSNSVLSDLQTGGGSVPIRYWSDRGSQTVRDVEIIPGWGTKPLSFQGLLNYEIVSVGFELLDDGGGDYLITSAREVGEALARLAVATTDANGYPVPRYLHWRDPKGRSLDVTMTDFEIDDAHQHNRVSGSMELTEVAGTPIGAVP